jgi:hypothetical protein
MNNNKNFKWIYEPMNYNKFIVVAVVSTLLTVLTMTAQHSIVTAIVEKHRIYDADSPEEVEWYKKTQRNMNRPMDKKINL